MAEKRSIEEINAYLECRNATYRAIQESDRSGYLDCFCNVCGQKFERKRSKLFQDCPICNNKKLVVGYNDMATTAKWMIPYLKDKDDANRYMKSASKRIIFKCPNCEYEKECKINNIFNFGFSCDICGDGISRPNKFARALFVQLPVDNLKFEYSADWTNGKRYDIYFEYSEEKYVVEMDGEQHFRDSEWGKKSSQQLNDGYKNLLSWQNGVHIIRIKAISMDYNEMINSFKRCEISELINISNVDWNKCIKNADNNYMADICKYFETHKDLTTTDIGEIYHLSGSTIKHYLQSGAKLGMCSYSVEEEKQKGLDKARKIKQLSPELDRNKLYQDICEYGSEHKDAFLIEIAQIFKITPIEVKKHIKRGIKENICEYSFEAARKRIAIEASKKSKELSGRKTSVYEGDILIGSYPTMKECVDNLRERFPEKDIKRDTIRKQLVKKPSYLYKGLLFISA